MDNKTTICEKYAEKLYHIMGRYKLSIISSLVAGLLAYMFVFSNKLLNLDEIAGLFSKGETLSSGRWALALTSYIFPDYSIPWFNGLISLILLTIAACLIIRIFDIKKPILRILLPALIIVFPSQIITFAYMFTCAPYALAVLLAVVSVYCGIYTGKKGKIVGLICLCFSIGIYQAYLSIAACLYIVYLIKSVLDDSQDVKAIIKNGLAYLLMLVISLLLYFIINKAVMYFWHVEYNSYADASFNKDLKSILFGLRVAFTAFVGYFYKGYYHLVCNNFSKVLHAVIAVILIAEIGIYLVKTKSRSKRLLLLALLILFPLSVNCLYIISQQRHTLMLYSFVGVYILVAVILEEKIIDLKFINNKLVPLVLGLIIICNVYYANGIYLKMKLEYENAYSFYSTLVTRVKASEGYNSQKSIVLIGDAHELLHESDEIDTSDIVGIMEGLINIYSKQDFMTYYVGYDPPPVDWQKWDDAGGLGLVDEMPVYPYDGSIKAMEDFVLVNLG